MPKSAPGPRPLTPEQITALPYRPCVGVMLVNAGGLVFTGERLDTPGAWQMPQGGVDKGEDPRAAALRELWEETGVTADLVDVVAQTDGWLPYDLPVELAGRMWGGKYRGQEQMWFLLRFKGRDDQIDIATEHPEFGRWRWAQVDDLVRDIVPFKRDIYGRVVAALAPKI